MTSLEFTTTPFWTHFKNIDYNCIRQKSAHDFTFKIVVVLYGRFYPECACDWPLHSKTMKGLENPDFIEMLPYLPCILDYK